MLQDDLEVRAGFVHRIVLRCLSCNWINICYTSKTADSPNSPGRGVFDANLRAVLAFREIGKGYKGMKTLAAFMNVAPPISKCNYNCIVFSLRGHWKAVALLQKKRRKRWKLQIVERFRSNLSTSVSAPLESSSNSHQTREMFRCRDRCKDDSKWRTKRWLRIICIMKSWLMKMSCYCWQINKKELHRYSHIGNMIDFIWATWTKMNARVSFVSRRKTYNDFC